MAACLGLFSSGFVSSGALGANGTFIDRELANDVRVAQYNTLNDSIFSDTDATRAAHFSRIAPAVGADVWMLQEVYTHSAAQVKTLFDTIAPIGGSGWFVYKADEFAFVSRYSLSLTRSNISPAGYKVTTTALVDIPAATSPKDLYLINAHFKAFSGFDPQRQNQADAIVSWQRDARTAGGTITLATGTPMVVAGDLNLVDGPQPYQTLLDGNIIDEATFGADSPPDWDGTASSDPGATQNDAGAANWTWRDDGSGYTPSRLDYSAYTDSIISAPHKFVLNTTTMSAGELSLNGLQAMDVAVANDATDLDHLPVVTDYRFNAAKTLVYNGGGTWNGTSAFWLNGATASLYATGDVARFKGAGLGTVNIIAAGVSPGAVIVSNSSGSYTFTGGAIGGTAYLSKTGTGTLILNNANAYTGGTTVSAGTLIAGNADALGNGSLLINPAGKVKAADSLPIALRVTALAINAGGSLDLRNDSLVIDYTGTSPITTLRTMLGDSRVLSTSGIAGKRIGYAESAAAGTFAGRSVDATALLIAYTYAGDTDLDGDVDISDLGNLASHWQTAGFWTAGDFDYNGTIDINDLGLLASNWQAGAGSFAGALASFGLPSVSVPEPATLTGIGIAALALRRHRRRI